MPIIKQKLLRQKKKANSRNKSTIIKQYKILTSFFY